MTEPTKTTQAQRDASEWRRLLAQYRTPHTARSLFELFVTVAPFVAIWAVAWWMLSVSTVLAPILALGNAAFLVHLFMIQHDCGHGSLLRSRRACDWLGRASDLVTLTPYDVWRKNHSIHHATTGNLDRRGIGDLPTLTVQEYREYRRPPCSSPGQPHPVLPSSRGPSGPRRPRQRPASHSP